MLDEAARRTQPPVADGDAETRIAGQRAADRPVPPKTDPVKKADPVPSARLSTYMAEAAELLAGSTAAKRKRRPASAEDEDK